MMLAEYRRRRDFVVNRLRGDIGCYDGGAERRFLRVPERLGNLSTPASAIPCTSPKSCWPKSSSR